MTQAEFELGDNKLTSRCGHVSCTKKLNIVEHIRFMLSSREKGDLRSSLSFLIGLERDAASHVKRWQNKGAKSTQWCFLASSAVLEIYDLCRRLMLSTEKFTSRLPRQRKAFQLKLQPFFDGLRRHGDGYNPNAGAATRQRQYNVEDANDAILAYVRRWNARREDGEPQLALDMYGNACGGDIAAYYRIDRDLMFLGGQPMISLIVSKVKSLVAEIRRAAPSLTYLRISQLRASGDNGEYEVSVFLRMSDQGGQVFRQRVDSELRANLPEYASNFPAPATTSAMNANFQDGHWEVSRNADAISDSIWTWAQDEVVTATASTMQGLRAAIDSFRSSTTTGGTDGDN